MRKLVAVGIGVSLVGAGLGLTRCHRPLQQVASVVESAASVDAPAAMKPTVVRDEPTTPAREEMLRGLDVQHVAIGDDGASASLPNGKTAHLTLDTRLQRTASSLMAQHKLPEAAVVVMDTKTGAVLVYASHVESGPARDLVVEAKAPSASVFKIVTASALVEHADLGADTKQCYAGGGEQRVTLNDLDEDPLRDKWCPTLATAMGKSTNTVFARLASKHLDALTLDSTARALGYGEPIAFDVPNEASSIVLPEDKLGFARTAAGFWNTTLSPLEAVMLSETIAREGEVVRPWLVKDVTDSKGAQVMGPPEPSTVRRAIKRETAAQVLTMMEHTVSEGTSFKAFHDPRGKAFLPGIVVAGKTGTLSDPDGARLYSWFTGFAPSRPQPGQAQVAIAVLIINGPKWTLKANVLAREVLRAWSHDANTDSTAERPR